MQKKQVWAFTFSPPESEFCLAGRDTGDVGGRLPEACVRPGDAAPGEAQATGHAERQVLVRDPLSAVQL